MGPRRLQVSPRAASDATMPEAMPDDASDDPDQPVELPIDGVLDLHTFDPREVGELVPAWIDACRARGIRELRIIHGKGSGALRRTVHAILARRTDLVEYRLAPPERGGWGATLVSLR
jgi:DNA-nicking Smr family endonuclease